MHFEWVGEPRDQLPYPSRLCGNIVDRSSVQVDAGDVPTQRATLYADAGLTDAHSHGDQANRCHARGDHDH